MRPDEIVSCSDSKGTSAARDAWGFWSAKLPVGIEFAAALAVVLAARASMIFPLNYSSDDYGWAFKDLADAYGLFAAEGRLLVYFLNLAADFLGASFPFLGALWPILGCAAAVFFGMALRLKLLPDCPSSVGITAVLIFVLFPYQNELMTFHIALPAITCLLVCAGLAILVDKNDFFRLVISSFLIAAAISYQIFLAYIAVAILFIALMEIQQATVCPQHDAGGAIHKYRRSALNLIALLLGVTIFLVSKKLTSDLTGWLPSGRSQIASIDDIPTKLVLLVKEVQYYLLRSEVMLPKVFKVLQLALVVIAVVGIIRGYSATSRSIWNCFLGVTITLAVLGLALIATPFPMMLLEDSRLSLNMRALSGLGVFWSGLFALSWAVSSRQTRKAVLGIGLLLVVGYSLQANQFSVDFARVNMREKMFANRVLSRLELCDDFARIRTVVVVGLSLNHLSYGFKTPVYSSMYYPYDIVALLSEVSGRSFAVPSATDIEKAEQISMNMPLWPHHDSVAVHGDIAVVAASRKVGSAEMLAPPQKREH
jgi:hypothetical protein